MNGSTLSRSLVRATYRAAAASLDLLGLKAAVRSHVLPRLLAAAQSSPDQAAAGAPLSTATAATIDAEIRRVLAEPGRILVGPWTSEVGFELLYWIPFLNWLRATYDVPAERLVAVTRGGAGVWYGDVAGQTVELFERVDPKTFRARTAERWKSVGGQKQIYLDEWENRLLQEIRASGVAAGNVVLHPYLMYALFYAVWQGALPAAQVYARTRFARLPAPAGVVLDLPDDFAAVRFYFRPSFPDTSDNRRLVATLVERLAADRPVVLLNPRLEIDDHSDWIPAGGKGVHGIRELGDTMTPATNLTVQSTAIARARVFVGTYGGLSYLAPFYGGRALALRSAPEHNLPVHNEVADVAARAVGGSLTVLDTLQLGMLEDLLAGPADAGMQVGGAQAS